MVDDTAGFDPMILCVPWHSSGKDWKTIVSSSQMASLWQPNIAKWKITIL